MQVRGVWHVALLAAAGLMLPSAAARAGDQYQCTLVQEVNPPNTTDIKLTKGGNKIKISPAPAAKPGTGMVMELTLKGVDCVLEGNDKGTAGKCGVAGSKTIPAAPVDAVLALSVHFAGLDLPGVTGVPIEFIKGAANFTATDKNKIDGSVFGALITAILGQPMGFGLLTVRTEGSDPTNVTTGCGVVPLPPVNTCLDGIPIFFTGITASL